MIALKKKPARRTRYRAFTADDVAAVAKGLDRRLGEVRAIAKDMAAAGVHAVEIDGAGSIERALEDLDRWTDLMTAAIVMEKRRRSRNDGL